MIKNSSFPLWVIIFILFINLPVFALPAQDVEIITNSGYFPTDRRVLKEAKSSIRLIMFQVVNYYGKYSDSPSNILIKELINAKKRGVNVEVILEIGKWPDVNEKNRKVGQMLLDSGIKVTYDTMSRNTHAKLLVVDNSITILGSTNWSYFSLTKNNEVSVLLKSKEVAQKLTQYFQSIWEYCRHE